MNSIVIGLLAHVDAGKTTTIERMLAESGKIRRMGSVDRKDTVLDYEEGERRHGITIESKEANFTWKGTRVFVIDTPGHADFSSEMERVLPALDLAVLVLSGREGVQSHSRTIAQCLEKYQVPSVAWVNKMDISLWTREQLEEKIEEDLGRVCVDVRRSDAMEKIALTDDGALEEYERSGTLGKRTLYELVRRRKFLPCCFGSAKTGEGIRDLLDWIAAFGSFLERPREFGAKVYKVSYDEKGVRLTHVKVTGGTLKARQMVAEGEKADQIRLYCGRSFESAELLEAGMAGALTGLQNVLPGQELPDLKEGRRTLLRPGMQYDVLLPQDADLLKFRLMCARWNEEDPSLDIRAQKDAHVFSVCFMGKMQQEVFAEKVRRSCGFDVSFGPGKIAFQETIKEASRGYCHYAPPGRFAEISVRLEPLAPGTGIRVGEEETSLSPGWRKAAVAALQKIRHKGVLTGSPLTDVKIVLTGGKGNLRETGAAEIREACRRAVRQGLMKSASVLLEPYILFRAQVPSGSLSRVLQDLQARDAEVRIAEAGGGRTRLEGRGPLRTLANYQDRLQSFTRGEGTWSFLPDGYREALHQEDLVKESHYDPALDAMNPSDSLLSAGKETIIVPWDQAEEICRSEGHAEPQKRFRQEELSDRQLKEMMDRLAGKSSVGVRHYGRKKAKYPAQRVREQIPRLPEGMVVDGYNLLYAMDELAVLGRSDLSDARGKLNDLLAEYAGYRGMDVVVVYDGYHVSGNPGSSYQDGRLSIVYTPAGMTVDSYIEKQAGEWEKKYRLTVVTSDALIQTSLFSQGALRMSSRELKVRLEAMRKGAGK